MPLANIGTIKLHYEIEGDGPPLLLISGTAFPGATWRTGISARFARAGFQVITYDHRGLGRSEKPDEPYSTQTFAGDAVGLLDMIGIEAAHIIGHSMGGRVAQWIALDHPDRVHRLVLAASGPGDIGSDFKFSRGIPLHTALALIEKGYERYVRDHLSGPFFFTPEFSVQSPEVVQQLVEAFWENRPSLKGYLLHTIARQEHQTAERLGDIQAPTLVVVGAGDHILGGTGNHFEQSKYLARHIPSAEFRVVENVSHGFFWEKPEQAINPIVEFLHRN